MNAGFTSTDGSDATGDQGTIYRFIEQAESAMPLPFLA
jgi:hypothetical protein